MNSQALSHSHADLPAGSDVLVVGGSGESAGEVGNEPAEIGGFDSEASKLSHGRPPGRSKVATVLYIPSFFPKFALQAALERLSSLLRWKQPAFSDDWLDAGPSSGAFPVLPDCRLTLERTTGGSALRFLQRDTRRLLFTRLEPQVRLFLHPEEPMNSRHAWELATDCLSGTWTGRAGLTAVSSSRLLIVLDGLCASPERSRPFSESVSWRSKAKSFASSWSLLPAPDESPVGSFCQREQAGFLFNRLVSTHLEPSRLELLWKVVGVAWGVVVATARFLFAKPATDRLELGHEGATLESFALPWVKTVLSAHQISLHRAAFSSLDACLISAGRKRVIHVAQQLDDFTVARHACHELAHLYLRHRPNSSYGIDGNGLDELEEKRFDLQEEEADQAADWILHCLVGLRGLCSEVLAESTTRRRAHSSCAGEVPGQTGSEVVV